LTAHLLPLAVDVSVKSRQISFLTRPHLLALSSSAPQFFGDDWANMEELDVKGFEAKLADLSEAEQESLMNVILKLDDLREIVDSVETLADKTAADVLRWQRDQLRAEEAYERVAGEDGSSGGSGGSSGSSRKEPYPAASAAMRNVIEVLQEGETVLVDPEREAAAAREREARARARRQQRGGDAGAAAGRREWGQWGPRAGGGAEGEDSMDARLDR
jgi:hypothetical protein